MRAVFLNLPFLTEEILHTQVLIVIELRHHKELDKLLFEVRDSFTVPCNYVCTQNRTKDTRLAYIIRSNKKYPSHSTSYNLQTDSYHRQSTMMLNTAARFVVRNNNIHRSSSRIIRSLSSAPTIDDNNHYNDQSTLSYDIVPKSDFGTFKEYSVIHTNRSLNIMSDPFQKVMRDLNDLLKTTYNADKVAIIPGSGTFGMESVARQFATDENVLVLRNGWFSFRWTEIFDMGSIPKSHTVLKARPIMVDNQENFQYAPCPVDEVIAKIYEERPATLFCAHVETSTGMILPDDYIRKISAAMHDIGGLVVLDCIASGTIWADMKDLGVDVVISAPQKGWTGPCCAALVMMSKRAELKMQTTKETSFSMSLKRWSAIMDSCKLYMEISSKIMPIGYILFR